MTLIWVVLFFFIMAGVGGWVLNIQHRNDIEIATGKHANITPSTTTVVATKMPSPSTTPAIAGASTSASLSARPEDTAVNFYAWYINCVKNHFDTNSSTPLHEECDYTQRDEVSSKFVLAFANSDTAYQKILCGKDIPDSIDIDHSNTTSVASIVYLNEAYSKTQKQITVELQNTNIWRIYNISCSK